MGEQTNQKPFSKPITIAGINYTHFTMRESTVDDMFAAEMELVPTGGGTHTPLVFNGQMMVRQLEQVSNAKGDSFAGPFTMNMLKNWGTRNYRALRNAQIEVDLLGEAELSDQEES